MQAVAYIGVGSNIDPTGNIESALRALRARLCITGCSTFYWSEPVARAGQPPFLNGVWRATTELGPHELKFELLRPVEHELGRRRSQDKHAARTIDLDLLLHGAVRMNEDDLVLPDPEIAKRPFLWVPLVELDPELKSGLGPCQPAAPHELRADLPFTQLLRAALSTKPDHEHETHR